MFNESNVAAALKVTSKFCCDITSFTQSGLYNAILSYLATSATAERKIRQKVKLVSPQP